MRTINTILIFLLAMLLLSSCAGRQFMSPSYVGGIADASFIQPLTLTKSEAMKWQAQHLSVDYAIQQSGNNLGFSGTLTMSDWIYYSFPFPSYFYFYIHYLDVNNRVISSHEISPLINALAQYTSTYRLRTPPPPPQGAESFVFSYWGNFQSAGRFGYDEDRGGDDWEIYFNPFLKEKTSAQ